MTQTPQPFVYPVEPRELVERIQLDNTLTAQAQGMPANKTVLIHRCTVIGSSLDVSPVMVVLAALPIGGDPAAARYLWVQYETPFLPSPAFPDLNVYQLGLTIDPTTPLYLGPTEQLMVLAIRAEAVGNITFLVAHRIVEGAP